MNPFLLKGYHSPEYFCDRVEVTRKIINAIENNQDITLYGFRRLGKSALIHHVFHHLQKDYLCIYADIWGTTSIEEFIKELANGIIKSNIFAKRKFSEKLAGFLKSIGASFTIGVDGMPAIEMIYNDRNQAFHNLDEIFGFLNQLKEPVILAVDEFQEIKKYESNAPFEGKMRTITQQCNNVSFLFSGSEFHLLNEIFSTYSKPFYQSTRMLSIDKIDHQEYKEFIQHHFQVAKKNLSETIIDHILEITHRHTYYTQAAMNLLFSQSKLPKTVAEFDLLFKEFVLEKSVFYGELPEQLTRQQFAVVKGFAKSGLVQNPNSADFMEKAKIRSASSMHRIIHSLLEKQIIIKDDNAYRLYDVFLELFLRYTM
ncbi:MAG: hypothetical protein KKA07_03865 [Bacteroidetes bacterium]|nr:hypothetical protein [Bacteroidota bacterium]